LTVLFVCAAMLTACDNPSARGTARFFVRDFGAVPDEAQADGDAIRKCIAVVQGRPASWLRWSSRPGSIVWSRLLRGLAEKGRTTVCPPSFIDRKSQTT
jgi:hypothetical protein